MNTPTRSHKKPAFAKGHLMTESQRMAYWSMFGQVCARLDVPASEREAFRRELHERAGLGPISVKAIDHLKMYDAIRGVFLAILRPGDMNAQLRQQYMSCTRLIVRIRQMAPPAYTLVIMRDRWGCQRFEEIDDLAEEQLQQLRNTLEARLAAKGRAAFADGQEQFEEHLERAMVLPDGHGEDGNNPF